MWDVKLVLYVYFTTSVHCSHWGGLLIENSFCKMPFFFSSVFVSFSGKTKGNQKHQVLNLGIPDVALSFLFELQSELG